MNGEFGKYGKDERVISLLREGYTNSEISQIAEIPVHQVWNVIRRNDILDEGSSPVDRSKYKSFFRFVQECLKDYSVITIEEGVTGGYIVTLNDDWTGSERRDMRDAVKSAIRVASGTPNQRDKG